MGVILVGMATPQQFEDALAAVHKGPLPPAALDRLCATAGIRRRTTLIAETGPGLSPGRHLWRAFSPLGAARRQRGHLSFKLVSRAKLVPYPVSLRLVFAHCGAWANDHCAPSIYGIWHHL